MHQVLLDHRALLAKFATEHNDTLAEQMLADPGKVIPFGDAGPGKQRKKK